MRERRHYTFCASRVGRRKLERFRLVSSVEIFLLLLESLIRYRVRDGAGGKKEVESLRGFVERGEEGTRTERRFRQR